MGGELRRSAETLSSRVISSKKRRTNCGQVKMKILKNCGKRKLAERQAKVTVRYFYGNMTLHRIG